jgi:hypothetical protein
MDFDRSSKLLTLLANFGVVAGLVFLAIEVRQNQVVLEQNQSLMERQYELEVVDGHQALADLSDQVRMMIAGDGELAGIWIAGMKGETLSESDQLRFTSLCDSKIWNEAVSYKRLTIIGRSVDAQQIPIYMRAQKENSPGYESCWNNNVEGLRLWGYDDLVNSVLAPDP